MKDAIDRQALEQMLESFGGDTEFLAEMIDTLFEDAPQQIDMARGGLGQGDCALVRRGAHSLKSTSASFGATALSASCARLEVLARDGEVEQGPALLAEIEALYKQAKAELEAIKAGL